MPAYKVVEITEGGRDKQNDPPNWFRHKVLLQNADGMQKTVGYYQPRSKPMFSVGQTIQGEIKDNERNPSWDPELTWLDAPASGGRGGGGGYSGRRPEDPKRMASIAMQHSQDTALRMVQFALENAMLKPAEGEDLWNFLRTHIATETDRFYFQVKKAQAET